MASIDIPETEELDKLSQSWSLESDYPIYRGTLAIIVSAWSLSLLIILIIKIIKKSREDPQHKPEVCKHCSICCGASKSRYFECKHLCVLPAPLDVAICIFFFGFLCFLANGWGILYYKSWAKASNPAAGHDWGPVFIYFFAVLVGLVALCVYMYFYSMLILTVSQAGDDFAISRCTQRLHKTLMILTAVLLPTGNIVMEVFGRDFGRTFRYGQSMAYSAFAFVFIGIAHLIFLLANRLQMVLVNSFSSDLKSNAHRRSVTELRDDVNRFCKQNEEREAQLIQVITKLFVITTVIIIICIGSGLLTGFRYYFAAQIKLATYLSLARWFYFTMINISFGAYCIYLTIGFNIKSYKFWCRCDKCVHQCVMCGLKRKTFKKIRVSVTRDSRREVGLEVIHEATDHDGMDGNVKVEMMNVPSMSPETAHSFTSVSDVNSAVITPQTTVTATATSIRRGSNSVTTQPSMVNGKMTSYSGMSNGVGVIAEENNVQNGDNNGQREERQEEKVLDLKMKMSDLANDAAIPDDVEQDANNDGHIAGQMSQSVSVAGYTPNAFNHMQSEQL